MGEGSTRIGAIRLSGVYIRAAYQPADWAGVHRIQSVEEERGPDPAEGGGTVGSPERSALGGGLSEAEPEIRRLAAVLLDWDYESSVSGSG